MEKLYEVFAKVVAGAFLIALSLTFGAFVMSFPVKWAWNGTMPYLFDLNEISYFQAFGLIWLFGILVKGSSAKSG